MVNTSICNGFVSSGCHQVFPTAYVGRSPRLVALDQEAGALFVTDRGSAAVSVLQTADCNSEVTKGCPALAAERPVGSKLVGLAVDQASSTVYVTNTVSGTMSVLNTN